MVKLIAGLGICVLALSAAVVRLENYHEASRVGMCSEFSAADLLNNAKRHECLHRQQTHTSPVPEQDRITGHKAKGSAGVRVYTHYTLETLKEDVEKISYPGLVLPKVYKGD